MKALLRVIAALVALFALYSLRAWLVVGGAFFGVVLLRGAYGLLREGERVEAGFMGAMGVWLLVVSYRWFAMRWRAAPPPNAPAA
jgi:hypothetical protein